MAMPTVLMNAGLSLVREGGSIVIGPDRLGAFVPMFDEEAGAARTIRSLLGQSEPLDELVISINGGSDGTPEVIERTLAALGYGAHAHGSSQSGDVTRWDKAGDGTSVVVVRYQSPTSKARSLNLAASGGALTAERVLVVDGDTVLSAGFAAAMRRSFYRLSYRRLPGGAHGYVLEDAALQSGAVRSLPGASVQARLISAARDAEYSFSTVVRSGQCARMGGSGVFGRSRLYTVVGCGFVARRDVLPMPDDTLTEDHDLTLAAQDMAQQDEVKPAADLDAGGYRLLVDGRSRPLSALIGPRTKVIVRRSSTARFVAGAVMHTEDPPRLGGLLRQVERWNGGAIENALKRVRPTVGGRLRPNVAFAVASAQVENVIGLFLALLLPAMLGLRHALPQAQVPAAMLVGWIGIDLLASLLIVMAGARRLGDSWGRAILVASRGVVPLLALRSLGALAYVTAATRVVPTFVRSGLRRRSGEVLGYVQRTWSRPRARVAPQAHLRTAGVATSVLLFSLSLFFAVAHVARAYASTHDTWRYVYGSPRLDQADFELLPVYDDRSLSTLVAELVEEERPGTKWVSPYCPPPEVAGWSQTPSEAKAFELGSDKGYQPLSPWGILMLARLAPLLTHLEEAARAYSLSGDFLLQVLLNESYLDPLARGPTNDIGLAQLTSDALTLVAAVSAEDGNPLRNEALFAGTVSAFDPAFSLCAGAAKLAWAESQPGGEDPEVAYARYINPFDGVRNGSVAPTHEEPVAAMTQLGELVQLLAAVVETYRVDPGLVSSQERELLDVASAVAEGRLSIRDAYRHVSSLVAAFDIDDRQFYRTVLQDLYGPNAPLPDVKGQLASAPRSR